MIGYSFPHLQTENAVCFHVRLVFFSGTTSNWNMDCKPKRKRKLLKLFYEKDSGVNDIPKATKYYRLNLQERADTCLSNANVSACAELDEEINLLGGYEIPGSTSAVLHCRYGIDNTTPLHSLDVITEKVRSDILHEFLYCILCFMFNL